jgi:hypothetical protein
MRLFVLTTLLIGCATAPPPGPKGGPRGLRANDHLDAARQHDAQARERASWPDTRGSGPGDIRGTAPGDIRQPTTVPWYRSWSSPAEHERAAAVHRANAAELHAEYDEACRDIPANEHHVSPLASYGVGGWNTASGVIMYLAPEVGAPDRLMARMKCHRAAMMIAPSGMENCPLDLPGIALDARGDATGVTVSLTVRDPKLVPELQRRAAHDLEAAGQRRAAPQ